MANLYGVANNIGIPIYTNLIGGANVAVPAGVETNVADSGLIIAPSNGYFATVWAGALTVTMGVSVPTSLIIAARIGAGSDYTQFQVPSNIFVASANLFVPFFVAGPSSQVPWQPPGSHVYLTVTAAGQAVNISQLFSTTFFWLIRGSDQ